MVKGSVKKIIIKKQALKHFGEDDEGWHSIGDGWPLMNGEGWHLVNGAAWCSLSLAWCDLRTTVAFPVCLIINYQNKISTKILLTLSDAVILHPPLRFFTFLDAMLCILIKKEIPHSFHTNTSNKNIMAVTLKTKQGNLTIITFYKPPRQKNLPLIDINNILQLNNPTLILADANLKHQYFGHKSNDQNGKLLKDFMIHSNLHFLGPYFDTFHEGNKKVNQT